MSDPVRRKIVRFFGGVYDYDGVDSDMNRAFILLNDFVINRNWSFYIESLEVKDYRKFKIYYMKGEMDFALANVYTISDLTPYSIWVVLLEMQKYELELIEAEERSLEIDNILDLIEDDPNYEFRIKSK